jgi:hypothetical protein
MQEAICLLQELEVTKYVDTQSHIWTPKGRVGSNKVIDKVI